VADKFGRFLHGRRQIFVGRFHWQTKLANFIVRLTSAIDYNQHTNTHRDDGMQTDLQQTDLPINPTPCTASIKRQSLPSTTANGIRTAKITLQYHHTTITSITLNNSTCKLLDQRFSNWGPRTKGGPRWVPRGSARGFRKVVIVCTVFNNLRPTRFQICTHKSVAQCIAWKCCPG